MIASGMPSITGWFIIGTAFIWLTYEAYLLISGKPPLSTVITKMANRSPIIVFSCGLLCGHWFWTTTITIIEACK